METGRSPVYGERFPAFAGMTVIVGGAVVGGRGVSERPETWVTLVQRHG